MTTAIILLSVIALYSSLSALVNWHEWKAAERRVDHLRECEKMLQKYRAALCVEIDILTGVRDSAGSFSPPYGEPVDPVKWYASWKVYRSRESQ